MKHFCFSVLLLSLFSPIFSQTALPFFDGQLWGVQDTNARVLLPAKYQSAEFFGGSYLILVQQGNRKGLINQKGEWLLKPEFDLIEDIYESVCTKQDSITNWYYLQGDSILIAQQGVNNMPRQRAKKMVPQNITIGELNFNILNDGKIRIKNSKLDTKHIIDANSICGFLQFENRDAIAIRAQNGLVGLLDSNGEVLIKPTMLKFWLVDRSGDTQQVFLPTSSTDTIPFNFALDQYIANVNNFTGMRSIAQNRNIIPFSYTDIFVHDNYYIANNGITNTIFDNDGKRIIEVNYSSIHSIGKNYFSYSESQSTYNKRGIIRIDGKKIIPPKYDWIQLHNSSLFFIARENNKCAVYNTKGQLLLPADFPLQDIHISPQANKIRAIHYTKTDTTMLMVMLDKNQELLDRITFKKFSTLRTGPNGMPHLWHQDTVRKSPEYLKWGILSGSGEVLLPHIFDHQYKLQGLDGKYITKQIRTRISGGLSYNSFNYGLVDYPTAKQILTCDQKCIFIDDLSNANFFRAWSNKNRYTLLNQDAKILFSNCAYIDKPADYMRIALGGSIVEASTSSYRLLSPDIRLDRAMTSSFRCQPYKLAVHNAKWGLINRDGEIILKAEYGFLQQIFQDRIIAEKGKKWGIIDCNGQTLVPFEFQRIEHFNDPYLLQKWLPCNYYKAKQKGLHGVIDTTGQIIVPFIYDDIYLLPNAQGNFFAVKQGGKWGLINQANQEVLPIKYHSVSYLSHHQTNQFKGQYNKKPIEKGYMNSTGKILVKLSDRNHVTYKDGYCFTRDKNSKVHITDTLDNPLFPQSYRFYTTPNNRAIWLFDNKEQWQAFDGKRQLISTGHPKVEAFSNGLAAVYRTMATKRFIFFRHVKKQWGYIDTTGYLAIPYQWAQADTFSANGYARVQLKKKWGIINRQGQLVVPCKYRDINTVDQLNTAKVCNKKRQWGYITHTGEWLFKPQFKELGDFADSLAYYKSNTGKYGFIHRNGSFAITPKFTKVSNFAEGFALADSLNYKGLIDTQGKWLVKGKFYKVSPMRDKRFYTLQTISDSIVEQWYNATGDSISPIIPGTELRPCDFVNDLAFYTKKVNSKLRVHFTNAAGKTVSSTPFRNVQRTTAHNYLIQDMYYKYAIFNQNGVPEHIIHFDVLKPLDTNLFYYELYTQYDIIDTQQPNTPLRSYYNIMEHRQIVQLLNIKSVDYILPNGRFLSTKSQFDKVKE